jgi:hypothetical protein
MWGGTNTSYINMMIAHARHTTSKTHDSKLRQIQVYPVNRVGLVEDKVPVLIWQPITQYDMAEGFFVAEQIPVTS